MTKPVCPKCKGLLIFRRWSERKPAKSEALAVCGKCGELWQIRFFNGVPTSEPYQVKLPAQKTRRGSWRLAPEREAAIIAIYGSVQNFLDSHPLVCMSLQYKS